MTQHACNDFAFMGEISFWGFVYAGLIALAIAFLAVSYLVKAASVNNGFIVNIKDFKIANR